MQRSQKMVCVPILIVVLICDILSVNCARILAVYPTTSLSHQIAFRPLTQELAKRGHEVTVITPDPAFTKGENYNNLKEIDVSHSYHIRNSTFESTSGNATNQHNQIDIIFHAFAKIFEEQLRNAEVTALIKNKSEKFDLILLEACNRPSVALTHIYKIPTIQMSSYGPLKMNSKFYGTPTHPFYYPSSGQRRIHNLTLWQKFEELFNHFYVERIIDKHQPLENMLMKGYFGDDFPLIHDLNNNLDMLFLNVHPLWENRRPVPPSVVYLGNMHQIKERNLPEDLKSYMDSAKNGIIYFSFGTNVKCSLLPIDLINKFINVFSKLPYNVLWKCNVQKFQGQPENVKISEWFPQADVLKHPNIKLFITQGGLQSTDEAIAAGVPLVGIPWLGDQWFNVEQYAFYKIGKRLDKETMTEDNLLNAIYTVINDTSYRRNVAYLRSLMYDQPQPPLQRALWWIEHVLKHGSAGHLRAPATNMHRTEYYELKLLLIIFVTLIAMSIVIIKISKYLLGKMTNICNKINYKTSA